MAKAGFARQKARVLDEDEARADPEEPAEPVELPAGPETGPRPSSGADASTVLVELRKLFDTLDKDHNGKVTTQEWRRKVEENEELLGKYFGGTLGTSHHFAGLSATEIGSAFERIDEDGSGELSWEEFLDALQL
jgi:hypothetical protein